MGFYKNMRAGSGSTRASRSKEFAIWKTEWNKQYGVNGAFQLPEVIVGFDAPLENKMRLLVNQIKRSIQAALRGGQGMGARTSVKPSTIERRRKAMSAPRNPRTDDFKTRYPVEPSQGGSAFGYDSGLLADRLRVRRLRDKQTKAWQTAGAGDGISIAFAISPHKSRAKAAAIQFNKREPLIALTQRDVDHTLRQIINGVVKMRPPRKKR